MIFNKKLDLAIEFASRAHKDQLRKTDKDLPYIYHPVSVGFILKNAGFSDDVVIAGILHDVAEDCGVEIGEIKNIFGESISYIVDCVSENKDDSWEKRKEDYHNRIMNSSDDVKAVSSADKLHNMYNILDLLEKGLDLNDFFKKDTNTTIDKYVKFVNSLDEVWKHPLVEELKTVSEKLQSYKK